MFTGDRSGDWLFRAMHRAGLAAIPTSEHIDDGQRLQGAFVTSAVHCAPPANRPSVDEEAACLEWTVAELQTLGDIRVVVALGAIGYRTVMRMAPRLGWAPPRPRPRFGHRLIVPLEDGPTVICCYHPSQQNTFTGRLTEPMLDDVFRIAVALKADR
jgi:uracil-DNA glycosylase family 4